MTKRLRIRSEPNAMIKVPRGMGIKFGSNKALQEKMQERYLELKARGIEPKVKKEGPNG